MTPSEFSLVLAFGFVSSLHCVQMCGPIVLTYSVAANTGSARRSLLGLHLAYNFGRTVTYMLLGAIAGLAGGTMSFFGHLAGIENVAAVVAGIAMVLAGLALLGLSPRIKGVARLRAPVAPPAAGRKTDVFSSEQVHAGLAHGLPALRPRLCRLIKAVGSSHTRGRRADPAGLRIGHQRCAHRGRPRLVGRHTKNWPAGEQRFRR